MSPKLPPPSPAPPQNPRPGQPAPTPCPGRVDTPTPDPTAALAATQARPLRDPDLRVAASITGEPSRRISIMDLAQLGVCKNRPIQQPLPQCVRGEALRDLDACPPTRRKFRIRLLQTALDLPSSTWRQWRVAHERGRSLPTRPDRPATIMAIAKDLARNGHPLGEIQPFLLGYYSDRTSATQIANWVQQAVCPSGTPAAAEPPAAPPSGPARTLSPGALPRRPTAPAPRSPVSPGGAPNSEPGPVYAPPVLITVPRCRPLLGQAAAERAQQLRKEADDRSARRATCPSIPARRIDLLDLARLDPMFRMPGKRTARCVVYEAMSFADMHPDQTEVIAKLLQIRLDTVRFWIRTHRRGIGLARRTPPYDVQGLVTALARDHHPLEPIQALVRTYYAAAVTPNDVERWVQTATGATNNPPPLRPQPGPPRSPGASSPAMHPRPPAATSPRTATVHLRAPNDPTLDPQGVLDALVDEPLSAPEELPTLELPPLELPPLELPPLELQVAARTEGFGHVPTSPSRSPSPNLEAVLHVESGPSPFDTRFDTRESDSGRGKSS